MKILSNRLPANIHRENAWFDMVTGSVTNWRLACLARSRQLKFHHARRMAERSVQIGTANSDWALAPFKLSVRLIGCDLRFAAS
jgi:hypothetical protein